MAIQSKDYFKEKFFPGYILKAQDLDDLIDSAALLSDLPQIPESLTAEQVQALAALRENLAKIQALPENTATRLTALEALKLYLGQYTDTAGAVAFLTAENLTLTVGMSYLNDTTGTLWRYDSDGWKDTRIANTGVDFETIRSAMQTITALWSFSQGISLGSAGKEVTLDPTGITAHRRQIHPDKSGTIALTSDLGETQLAEIYKTTFNASSAASYSNASNFTFGAGGLSLSGSNTAANNIDQAIEYSAYTTLIEDYKRSIKFIYNGTAGNGVGIGIKSGLGSFYGRINLNSGQLTIETFRQNVIYTRATSSANLSFASGNQVELIFTRKKSRWVFSARNITTNSSVSVSFNNPFTYSAGIETSNVWNEGKAAIFHFGGSLTISEDSYIGLTKKQPKALIVGDSLTAGSFATRNEDRYAIKIANATSDRIDVMGGGGMRSAGLVALLPEILLISPEVLIINIGVNDVLNAVAKSTYLANITTIVDTCIANGIMPVLTYIFPVSNGTNNTTLTDWNTSSGLNTFSSKCLVIDTKTPLGATTLTANFDAGDGIHLNALGNHVLAATIISGLSGLVNFHITRPGYATNFARIEEELSANMRVTRAIKNTLQAVSSSVGYEFVSEVVSGLMFAFSSTHNATNLRNKAEYTSLNGSGTVLSARTGTVEIYAGDPNVATNLAMTISAGNRITLNGVPSYANDAAAATGGLPVGTMYFNTTGNYYTKRLA